MTLFRLLLPDFKSIQGVWFFFFFLTHSCWLNLGPALAWRIADSVKLQNYKCEEGIYIPPPRAPSRQIDGPPQKQTNSPLTRKQQRKNKQHRVLKSHPAGWPKRGLSIWQWFLKGTCQRPPPFRKLVQHAGLFVESSTSRLRAYFCSGGLEIKGSIQKLPFSKCMFLIRN